MEHTQILTDLTGKKALVTGGTKGIGKAIANELAMAGAEVIITARTHPESPAHQFIAADMTNADDVAQLVKKAGAIDILINNVGGLTTPPGGFSALSDSYWGNELQLNLIAATRLDRMLIPQMLQKPNSVIIHISSVAGKQPLWNLNMAYAASKAALNSYSKSLAIELASKGMRVLTVAPGATRTATMQNFIADYAAQVNLSVEEAIKQLLVQTGGIPMGRMAEPEDVASLVHYLVSPAAAYLTGSIYAIDGGSLPTVS